MTGDKLPISNN